MKEITVIKFLKRYLKNRGWDLIQLGVHDVDILARKSGTYFWIQCKGNPTEKAKHPHAQSLKYVQIVIGQIISKMKHFKGDLYGIAFPSDFEPFVKRHMPRIVAKKLKLSIFFVDHKGNVREIKSDD